MPLVIFLVCAVHPIRGRDKSFLRRCRKERMEGGSERLPCWVAKHHLLIFLLFLISSVLHTPVEKKER